MKREIHEANIRQRIIKVARRLFFHQGYNKTGIRQIGEAASVKTGTIYHFFANKESILQQVALEAFHRVIERTSRLSSEDMLLESAAEVAWHVYTMAHHKPSAEMYLATYNSPMIAAEILTSQINRSKVLISSRRPDLSAQQYEVLGMFIKGIMQSITLKAFDESLANPTFMIRETMTNIFRLVDIPHQEIKVVMDKLDALDIEQRVLKVLGREVIST